MPGLVEQSLPISQAKIKLGELVERSRDTVLIRHSRKVGAVVPIARYRQLMALEFLVRHPDLFDELRARAARARKTPLAELRSMKDLEEFFDEAGEE